MCDAELELKLERMSEILVSLKRVVVAFSAGVDSTFVLKVAADRLGVKNVLAATGQSDALARDELEQAGSLTGLLGVEHVVIVTNELSTEDYASNPTNRCYFCKTVLYEHLTTLMKQRGFCAVVNGANADDLQDYRPGLLAATEYDVRSPAAEVGLTKQDIRVASERLGLPTFDKPASPCLSSRIQYGQRVTTEKLRMIESCESFLRSLGFRECRVRHHDKIARIEVPASQIGQIAEPDNRLRIEQHFRDAGFPYVTLDLRGLRSGSMNEVIGIKVLPSR
jgi:pyridinium-3,5-biscarboxylic acid mononucleotide sulfurtransferase